MNILDYLIKPYDDYTTFQIILEAVAATLGVISVILSVKRNIWVYPTGIVSTVIYVYILFVFGLLGDMLINVYYTVMSVYGWVLWSKSAEGDTQVKVGKTTRREWNLAQILFAASLILVTLVYYFKPLIDNKFDTNGVEYGFHHLDWANWLDVAVTATFLVGMWMMAKRKIENWIFWIIGDIICVPIMLYKGLGITSIQYFIFTLLAVKGYFEWRKQLKAQTAKL